MSNMRMNKTGIGQAVNSATPTLVTGWAADAGYPATVISSNALIVDADGSYQITAQVNRSLADSATPLMIYVNGAVATTFNASTSSGTKVIPAFTRTLAIGDAVDLRVRKGSSGDDAFVVNQTNTFVQIVAINTDWTADGSSSVGVTPASDVSWSAQGSASRSVSATPTSAVARTTYGGTTLQIALTATAEMTQAPGMASQAVMTVSPTAAIHRDRGVSATRAVTVGRTAGAQTNRVLSATRAVTVTPSSATAWSTRISSSYSVTVTRAAAATVVFGGQTSRPVTVTPVASAGLVHGAHATRTVSVVASAAAVVRPIPTLERMVFVGREVRVYGVVPDPGPLLVDAEPRVVAVGPPSVLLVGAGKERLMKS